MFAVFSCSILYFSMARTHFYTFRQHFCVCLFSVRPLGRLMECASEVRAAFNAGQYAGEFTKMPASKWAHDRPMLADGSVNVNVADSKPADRWQQQRQALVQQQAYGRPDERKPLTAHQQHQHRPKCTARPTTIPGLGGVRNLCTRLFRWRLSASHTSYPSAVLPVCGRDAPGRANEEGTGSGSVHHKKCGHFVGVHFSVSCFVCLGWL